MTRTVLTEPRTPRIVNHEGEASLPRRQIRERRVGVDGMISLKTMSILTKEMPIRILASIQPVRI